LRVRLKSAGRTKLGLFHATVRRSDEARTFDFFVRLSSDFRPTGQ
jgi:hypothetical protein